MEIIKEISELSKKDSFLITFSVKKGDNIETKCLTNNFAYADIPIAIQDVINNIGKLAVQSAPPTPLAFQDADDVVVYADGEEE